MRVQKLWVVPAFTVLLFVLFSSAFAGELSTKVIYGDDDRQDLYQVSDSQKLELAKSTAALIAANRVTIANGRARIATTNYGRDFGLCRNEPFYAQPMAAFCSGALVGPDLLMTAGHCITNETECKATKFVFGFSVTQEGVFPAEVASKDVVGCKSIVRREYQAGGLDYALIRLDRKITHRASLAINRANDLRAGDSVGVIGHPSGLPTKVAFGASVVRDVSNPEYFVANLDTYGGNSGSAVFNTITGKIEGILVRGEQDFVFENGCRRSKVCGAASCRGEDIIRISTLSVHIPEL